MKKSAIIMLQIMQASTRRVVEQDLEVPVDIAAERVIAAIAKAYHLGPPAAYLTCENPIVLIRGGKTLAEYGVHDGSTIRYIY